MKLKKQSTRKKPQSLPNKQTQDKSHLPELVLPSTSTETTSSSLGFDEKSRADHDAQQHYKMIEEIINLLEQRLGCHIKEADDSYTLKRFDEALSHYSEILTLAHALCEASPSIASHVGTERRARYQKVIATTHFRIAIVREELANSKAAMNEYAVALLQYVTYVELVEMAQHETHNANSERRHLRSLALRADERMGVILAKMGSVQIQSDNASLALELNQKALRIFKHLVDICTEIGFDERLKSVEKETVNLLATTGELRSFLGDIKGSKLAWLDAFKVQKRTMRRENATSDEIDMIKLKQRYRSTTNPNTATQLFKTKGSSAVDMKDVARWRRIAVFCANPSRSKTEQDFGREIEDMVSISSTETHSIKDLIKIAGMQVRLPSSTKTGTHWENNLQPSLELDMWW